MQKAWWVIGAVVLLTLGIALGAWVFSRDATDDATPNLDGSNGSAEEARLAEEAANDLTYDSDVRANLIANFGNCFRMDYVNNNQFPLRITFVATLRDRNGLILEEDRERFQIGARSTVQLNFSYSGNALGGSCSGETVEIYPAD